MLFYYRLWQISMNRGEGIKDFSLFGWNLNKNGPCFMKKKLYWKYFICCELYSWNSVIIRSDSIIYLILINVLIEDEFALILFKTWQIQSMLFASSYISIRYRNVLLNVIKLLLHANQCCCCYPNLKYQHFLNVKYVINLQIFFGYVKRCNVPTLV